METTLKLILFFIFFFAIIIGFYKTYKYYNEKIEGSSSGWELLGFSFLLIVINVVLFFAGLYLLIMAFTFLADNH